MNVRRLIEKLSKYDGDRQVVALHDGDLAIVSVNEEDYLNEYEGGEEDPVFIHLAT